MGRKSKLTQSHHALLTSAEKLRRWAEYEKTVERIVAGHIRRTRSSTNVYKLERQTGCMKVTIKNNTSIQIMRFYISDAKTFEERLRAYAQDENIKVLP